MLSSHVKKSPLPLQHDKSHLSQPKKSHMVWYFIDVYIINRTLHGSLEIQNFSSRVEKMFHSFAMLTCEIFFCHWKRNFVSDSLLGHIVSPMYVPQNSYLGITFPGMSILNGDLARHMPFLIKKVFAVLFFV